MTSRLLSNLFAVEDVRAKAKRRLPRMVFDFIDGGADDEVTLQANESAFSSLRFRPQALAGVADRDPSVTILGHDLSFPAVLAPAGLLRLVSLEGDIAAARAAGHAGTVFTVSTASSHSIEEVAAAQTGPLWFQLYLWRDRSIIHELIERAERAGYTALVLTIDVPVVGKKRRDLRSGMTLPPRMTVRNAIDILRHPRWIWHSLRGAPITFANLSAVGEGDKVTAIGQYVSQELTNAGQSWADLAWLRQVWDGPLLVKGVMTGDDARRAVDAGADGVVVSNHGGRQMDGLPGSLEVLPEVVSRVGAYATVLLDGGIRSGVDIAKACALGAEAVMIGRPYVYGLAAGGDTGVSRVLEILRDEYARTLTLLGCARSTELNVGHLRVPVAWET